MHGIDRCQIVVIIANIIGLARVSLRIRLLKDMDKTRENAEKISTLDLGFDLTTKRPPTANLLASKHVDRCATKSYQKKAKITKSSGTLSVCIVFGFYQVKVEML